MDLSRRTVLLAAGALAAGAAEARAQPAQDDAALKALYEAAKKEGQLTWYSGILDQPLCDKIGAAFTQKYPGVRLNAIKTTSQVAFQRVMQDSKAGAPQSDVFTTTDASHMTFLKGKNMLVQYKPQAESGLAQVAAEFRPRRLLRGELGRHGRSPLQQRQGAGGRRAEGLAGPHRGEMEEQGGLRQPAL